MANEPAVDTDTPEDETEGGPSRRELAVARSLDPARARAEKRVQRFLDAAQELMRTSDKEFTVQEVVERSGQSLRSFYQYFAGKHELLLAIFEEGIRTSADELNAAIEGIDDPLERLHRFTVEQYRRCQPTPRGKGRAATPIMEPAIIDFAQQLLTSHPKEASRAFRPVVAILEQLLADAAEAGAIRPELASRRVAGAMLGAVMFNTFGATISGSPVAGDEGAEELWDVILHGMAPEPA